MEKYIKTVLNAIMAGMLIAVSATIYLTLKSEYLVLGACLFGFGLLMIVSLDFKLYTGRIGYLIDMPKNYILEILFIILGNVLGVILITVIIYISNMNIVMIEAQSLVNHKLSRNLLEMLGLSIFCGMMMYLGIDGYKRIKNDVAKVVVNLFAVVIFILAGFEHSIANIYYFLVANTYDIYMIPAIIIMLLGNAIGAILLNLIEKLATTKQYIQN